MAAPAPSAKCPGCRRPGSKTLAHRLNRVRVCLNPKCPVGGYLDRLPSKDPWSGTIGQAMAGRPDAKTALGRKASAFGWTVA